MMPTAVPAPTAAQVTHLRSQFEAAGQGHVFRFWDTLRPEQQQALFQQLQAVGDPQAHGRAFREAMANDPMNVQQQQQQPSQSPPPPVQPIPKQGFVDATDPASCTPEMLQRYQHQGLEAMRHGQVAVLLLAGGQGTRLGSSDPKGCFDIGLPSHKSLFQLQAERLQRLQHVATMEQGGPATIPWYIMVSEPTKEATQQFFQQHHYFGLPPNQVHFFEQGTLPVFQRTDGTFLMEAKDRLALAPDGNGGLFTALARPLLPKQQPHPGGSSDEHSLSVIDHLRQHGVQYVHVYCVDNGLARVADPVFVGLTIDRQAEVAIKTVTKTDPNEPVGVVCQCHGRYTVVEYSELAPTQSQARDPQTNHLVLSAANIANHVFTRTFLERMASLANGGGSGGQGGGGGGGMSSSGSLGYHVAHKKVGYVDVTDGSTTFGQVHPAPPKPNAVKLERFIFDVFREADPSKVVVYNVPRCEEFAPLKNKEGADSPRTCRQALMAQHRRFLEAVGARLERQAGGESKPATVDEDDDAAACEISPLVSYAGEGLERYRGETLTLPVHLK